VSIIDVCVRPNDSNITYLKSAFQIYFLIVVYSLYKKIKEGGEGEGGTVSTGQSSTATSMCRAIFKLFFH
jgi:hypothetical protein